MIRLEISGRPEGKARARFDGKRIYTPTATKLAESRVIDAWTSAGQPRLEGAVKVELVLNVARPKDHYTSKGALSAKGLRMVLPTGKKPDVDNALKLVMDALNRRAYRDDVDVIAASVERRWAVDNWESTVIVLEGAA
jgi:Holliday junction resolvase RusA-like endonuclease